MAKKNTSKKKRSKKNTPKAVPVHQTWNVIAAIRAVSMPSDLFMNARDIAALFIKETVDRALLSRAEKKEEKANSSKRTKEHALAVSNIAYRFIGYPDEVQQHELMNNIGGCRWLWNRLKGDRDDLYKQMGITVKNTPADYKDLDECAWLNDLDSYALCNVQLQHERAYNEYLKGEKGFPRFKKKGLCRNSYTTNKDKRSDNVKLEGNMLTLPKITGAIRLNVHRTMRGDLTLKTCTVCLEPDGKWMFSLMFEYPAGDAAVRDRILRFFETGDEACIRHIGLDMSLPDLFVDSDGCLPSYMNDGTLVEFRKCYRALERRIAKEQRKLSRMVKDSNNYKKQCVRIAKLHAKAKHQRSDFLHQLAVRLAKYYDIISIEDLDMAAIKQALKFGKSVSDNGWGTFIRILEQKCEEYGSVLVRVGRFFPSSKTCSHCGHVHAELKLSDRVYICPKCGHVMNRDHQAAVNIDREGLRIFLSCDGSKGIKKKAA